MAIRLMRKDPYSNDQALLHGLKKNETTAFESLYQKNFGKIKQWVMNNNGSEQDAEDIFQEAVLAIWKNVKQGKYEKKEGVKLSTYLFQVCKFRWFENLKSARVKHHAKLSTDYDVVDQNDLEDLSEQADRVNYLHKLFHQLGEKCQQILRLYYYQKLPLAKIAEQLDYTSQSAKNEKYRCMKRLRKLHNT